MSRKGSEQDHVDKVRRFYDRESERYVARRYGTEDAPVSRPYLERFRLLQELFDVGDCAVLDLGCGPGILEPYLLERRCDVFAVDLSEQMILKARQAIRGRANGADVHFCVASADSLPFRDACFDAVACIGVVSYWPDVSRGLSEIARVLRPGGVVVVQASNSLAPLQIEEKLVRQPYLWLRTAATGRDYRDGDVSLHAYTPWRLEGLLRAAGLRPTVRRSYDFQVPFLSRISDDLAQKVTKSLMRLSRFRWLGLAGAGYLVRAIRQEGGYARR